MKILILLVVLTSCVYAWDLQILDHNQHTSSTVLRGSVNSTDLTDCKQAVKCLLSKNV